MGHSVWREDMYVLCYDQIVVVVVNEWIWMIFTSFLASRSPSFNCNSLLIRSNFPSHQSISVMAFLFPFLHWLIKILLGFPFPQPSSHDLPTSIFQLSSREHLLPPEAHKALCYTCYPCFVKGHKCFLHCGECRYLQLQYNYIFLLVRNMSILSWTFVQQIIPHLI
jgi:hypothetical protein